MGFEFDVGKAIIVCLLTHLNQKYRQQCKLINESMEIIIFLSNNNPHQMFSKLKQFITSAVTPISSYRPSVPSDPALDSKLKSLLDILLKAAKADQFKVYQQFQSELQLNKSLTAIYRANDKSNEQVVAILNFFTFLLGNCSNQLVICKIVSEELLFEMMELHALGDDDSEQFDLQQINAYKIALIRAYTSNISESTLPYMISTTEFPLLSTCLGIYYRYLEKEPDRYHGVEMTCVSNCVLMILQKSRGQQVQDIVFGKSQGKQEKELQSEQNEPKQQQIAQEDALQSPKQRKSVSLQDLITLIISKLHYFMGQIATHPDLQEPLESHSLFLLDLLSSLPPERMSSILYASSSSLALICSSIQEVITSALLQQDSHQYLLSIVAVKWAMKVMAKLEREKQIVEGIEEVIVVIAKKFIEIVQQIIKSIREQLAQEERDAAKISQLEKELLNMLCTNMEVIARLIKSPHCALSSRTNPSSATPLLVSQLTTLLQQLLSPGILALLCISSVQHLLFSLFSLCLTCPPFPTYSILHFFILAAEIYLNQLKDITTWGQIVMNYQAWMRNVNVWLLDVGGAQASLCSCHQKGRVRDKEDNVKNIVFVYECARNYRFMMVEKTHLDVKLIKLQKIYHKHFITNGWKYQPGSTIPPQTLHPIELNLHNSSGILAISLIPDDECLIFSTNKEPLTVLLNIRYKNIHGFMMHGDIIHIQLKGVQEILVSGGKENAKKFKDYLIDKRDKSRQKQLKFIHYYLDIYVDDAKKIMLEMGQEDIQGDSQKKDEEEKQKQQSKTEQNQKQSNEQSEQIQKNQENNEQQNEQPKAQTQKHTQAQEKTQIQQETESKQGIEQNGADPILQKIKDDEIKDDNKLLMPE